MRGIEWHAKFNVTALVSLDASFDVAKDGEGKVIYEQERAANGDGIPVKVVSRAVCFHEGSSMGALMEEEAGHDNYLGEMAVQIDALDKLPPGGRVVIVFRRNVSGAGETQL